MLVRFRHRAGDANVAGSLAFQARYRSPFASLEGSQHLPVDRGELHESRPEAFLKLSPKLLAHIAACDELWGTKAHSPTEGCWFESSLRSTPECPIGTSVIGAVPAAGQCVIVDDGIVGTAPASC